MAKELVTLHIYASTSEWDEGKITVNSTDYRDIPSCMKDLVYLGSQSVCLSWADINMDQAKIDSLEAQIRDERASSHLKINSLLERISKLQSLGHEVAE